MEVTYKKAETNEEIRNWIESNEGKPAIIDDPETGMDETGLRVNFPGRKDERMLSKGRHATRNISWEEFFEIMDRQNLIFEYSNQEDVDLTWRYRFGNKYQDEQE